jgi:membrane-bound ClpP family serine protease
MAQQDIKLENFEDRLKSIELRLEIIESELALNKLRQPTVEAEEHQTNESSSLSEAIIDEEKRLESRIGRIGLAWLGNFVLLFAIVFFTEYIIAQGHGLLSLVIGVSSVCIIFSISNYLKKINSSLSFMLKINGQVLLFYEAFKMHFFSLHPLISSKIIVLIILGLVIAFQIYTTLKTNRKLSVSLR